MEVGASTFQEVAWKGRPRFVLLTMSNCQARPLLSSMLVPAAGMLCTFDRVMKRLSKGPERQGIRGFFAFLSDDAEEGRPDRRN